MYHHAVFEYPTQLTSEQIRLAAIERARHLGYDIVGDKVIVERHELKVGDVLIAHVPVEVPARVHSTPIVAKSDWLPQGRRSPKRSRGASTEAVA